MQEFIPTKAEIFKLAQAQSESIKQVSERLVKIEGLAEKQESRNKDIIIAVLVAFVAIVVTVAVQVSVSDKRELATARNFFEKSQDLEVEDVKLQSQIESIRANNIELKKEIDLIKTRNPYLK